MTKTIHNDVLADIQSGNFAGVVLAKLHFGPDSGDIQRYCNAYQNIYWDEGAGEQEYIGLGHLASMSVLTETTELSAQTIQLQLSGIPNDTITNIFSDDYIGKPVYIWYATLDKDTLAIQGGQAGPVLLFAGLMDFGNIEFGQTSTIIVNASNRLSDWERPRGGRFNQSYQIRHVDPTDYGFKYMKGLQNMIVSWGGVVVGDPGSSGGGGNDGGGNGGGGEDNPRGQYD